MIKISIKIIKVIMIVFMVVVALTPAYIVAQDYVPISTVPGISTGDTSSTGLQTYLSNVFTFVVSVGAILAVIQIAIGGVQYMTSSAAGSIESAKSKIRDAIIGLILLLSTSIILNQINPNILKFKLGPASGGGAIEYQIIKDRIV
jgi:hypothetical protein